MTLERAQVMMVDSETTWRGGEGQLALLMRGLKSKGVHVALASPAGSAIEQRARDMDVETLPLNISGGFDLGAAWKLRSYLRRRDYDIVHAHSSHAHGVAFLADRMGRRSGGRPRLVVSRRVDFKVAGNGFSALKYRHGADVYIAISNGVRDVLVAGDIEPSRIELVRSGIDMKKFDGVTDHAYLREEFALDGESPVVGNVAALAPHKSQVDFIEAAALVLQQVENARFFIVGEGELREELQKRITSLGLDERVILTGFRRDVLEFISLFDCFVLSSRLEGLCTSIMDAQALGAPVVATRTGGVPDLVTDEVTGMLVPPADPESLAAAIVRMVTDRKLATRCAANAREKALREYDYHLMVDGTAQIYERLLSRPVN